MWSGLYQKNFRLAPRQFSTAKKPQTCPALPWTNIATNWGAPKQKEKSESSRPRLSSTTVQTIDARSAESAERSVLARAASATCVASAMHPSVGSPARGWEGMTATDFSAD